MMIKSPSLLFLLIGLFFNTSIYSQPELDTTFNSSGTKVVAGFLAAMKDIKVQPDNKIVFVTGCSNINGSYNVCLGRLNENGTADATFGSQPVGSAYQGFSLLRIPGATADNSWNADGLAIQNDGKIIVVGSSKFSGSQINLIVLRYNSNGTLDTAFGTNGVVRTVYHPNNLSNKVLIQPDGKIVLVGYIQFSDSAYQQLIVRYNSDGTLDQTFSGDGFLEIEIPGQYTSGLDIALQADGKILTGGAMWTTTGNPGFVYSSLLIRLNRDGTFDATFDQDGIKTIVSATPVAFYQGFHSIAVQSDGKILGLSNNKKLYRFNSDGSLNTSFDTDGSRDVLSADSTANDVIVTPSGKITVVGERTFCNCSPAFYRFHAGKYLPDGSADTSFSNDGFLDIDISAATNDAGIHAAYDSSGRIAFGGVSANGGLNPFENSTWSFARLIASPAQNVGFTGRVTDENGRAVINAYLTLKNGSEIIGYARTNPFGYFRFTNVPSNVTYTLSTVSKNLNFYDRSVLVDGAIENYLVVGE